VAEPQAPGASHNPSKLRAVVRYRQENGAIVMQGMPLEQISGIAPKCRLVSLKVLDRHGKGAVSNLIAAIAHIQELNGYGRRLLIHGVNMSLGYNFEPEWFACGQSPLCVEVDRLVKSGVVVVVAAGNTGYGFFKSSIGSTSAGMDVTINDPGNADMAITVGSTHRDMPHVYGVSYFSSKGPTGDGRLKPDLVAPGEKIVSCAARDSKLKTDGAGTEPCEYVETSGTSMAAPHVSGVIAAFLSVRGEFIGRPEKVKSIFVSTATDLNRDRYFQGAGLVDLMRAIQSV
jgi:subtilisin family serine protease